MGEQTGPIHLGSDGVDVESPVEVFCQLHAQVIGLLDFSKDLAMEGVVDVHWFPLSGDCQEVALVNVE